MPLTKEDIEKIEEEERVRAQARLKYGKKQEKEINANKKTSPITWFLTIIIVTTIFICVSNESAGMVTFWIVGGMIVYFLPSIISYEKKKKNSQAILTLNLLLGWTLIGWVVAIVWANTKD